MWLELVGVFPSGEEMAFIFIPEDLPFIEAEAMNLMFFGVPEERFYLSEERVLFDRVYLEYHSNPPKGKHVFTRVTEWTQSHPSFKERKHVRSRRPKLRRG